MVYKTKKTRKHKFSYWALSEFYYLLLMKVTILPICILESQALEQFKKGVGEAAIFVRSIPFSGIEQYFYSFYGGIQLFGNIILLMPIVAVMKWFSLKRYSNVKIILSVICISVGIESIQFLINWITEYPSHLTDINDLIFNVSGGVLCLAVCRIIEEKFSIIPKKLQGILLVS